MGPAFSHPSHPMSGIRVLDCWPRYSHYSVLYELPETWEARINFDSSFRGWIPGHTWLSFDKTQVKMLVIDWQGARRVRAGAVTVMVQCRYELPWPNL